MTGVCASLKTEHCKAGSPNEKFMKENCKKTCEFCCGDSSGFQGILDELFKKWIMHEHCTIILAEVCANLKTLHTCADGKPYEKFMKDHCKKTCEKCGELKVPLFPHNF